MLKHFLKRDFNDLKLFWIINLLVFLSMPLGLFIFKTGLMECILSYSYAFFLLSVLPFTHIVGSNWRNQHFLSRYYLLSLPVSHSKLFVIQQLRILTCWLSLITFLFLVPVIILIFAEKMDVLMICRLPIYYTALTISILFMVNFLMYITLQTEKITSYKLKSERFWSHVSLFVTIMISSILLIIPWAFTFGGLVQRNIKFDGIDNCIWLIPLLFMIPMSVLGLFFYFKNKKDWCITFSGNKKHA